jgi:hypothetical protein
MCDNDPGSISTNVTGVAPYTYQWDSGETTPNISNLGVGGYSVEVLMVTVVLPQHQLRLSSLITQ